MELGSSFKLKEGSATLAQERLAEDVWCWRIEVRRKNMRWTSPRPRTARRRHLYESLPK